MASPRPLRELARADARSSTRQRLLEAAEGLIAERGVEALSMRAVTQAAGVSVSAANYHFGSKEALVQATLWRVLAPLNQRRLERLDALEAAATDADPPGLEALVEAFLRPAFEIQSRSGGGVYRRFAVLLHSGPPEFEARMKVELLNPSFVRFVEAMSRVLPDRDPRDVALAFQLALGATLHALRGHAERLADVQVPDEELLQRLVRFAAAGIRAACPGREESGG